MTLADPLFLGLHDLRGAEMSCKVLAKRSPEERAGTVGRRGDRTRVIEYTEVDPWHREERDASGELVYWAASIGIHVLSTAFVRRVAAEAERVLPYHASPKAIPCLGPGGRRVVPEAPNGYKLERFVFDALPEARRVALLEVRRARGVLTDQESERQRVALHGAKGSRRELPPLAPRGGRPRRARGRLDRARRVPDRSARGPPRGRPRTRTDWILFGNRGIA